MAANFDVLGIKREVEVPINYPYPLAILPVCHSKRQPLKLVPRLSSACYRLCWMKTFIGFLDVK
ncbi:hypothetical protein FLM06_04120 [Vibrio cholerae]|nr:hypothetical protein FLM06_04120 [Vibrio cholerae]TQP12954.1 hypothetical protein FLM03_07860 [Vibrio cholerae]TQP25067.1 hypothetical protein FLL94_10190 [Vibrio cholerae]TQP50220.1 hypothetical protein FLL99_02865 [Vibrio cholerae]